METSLHLGWLRASSGLVEWRVGRTRENDATVARIFLVPARASDLPPSLAAAWGALGSVGSVDASVAAALIEVLTKTRGVLGTQPLAPAAPGPLPTFPSRRATAAHPRGFRGTKYQPPKAPGATPNRLRDLRPYLRHPRDLLEVSRLFSPPLPLPEAPFVDPEVGEAPFGTDPTLNAAYAWIAGTDGVPAATAVFRLLKPAFVSALGAQPDGEETPEAAWQNLLEALIATTGGADAFVHDKSVGSLLASLPATQERPWRQEALRALRAGIPVVHLEAVVGLAHRYRAPRFSLTECAWHQRPVVETAEELMTRVETLLLPALPAVEKDGGMAVWAPYLAECLVTAAVGEPEVLGKTGVLPETGLFEVLEGARFQAIAEPEVRFLVLRSVCGRWGLQGLLPPATLAVLLDDLGPSAAAVEITLSLAVTIADEAPLNAPAATRAAVASKLLDALRKTRPLRDRLAEAVPSLGRHETLHLFLRALARAPASEPLIATLASAPLSALRRFVQATNRVDWTYSRATTSFLRSAPSLLESAFVACPLLLAKALTELGHLPHPTREALLRQVVATEFPQDLSALCAFIDDAQGGFAGNAPPRNSLVPRAVRERLAASANTTSHRRIVERLLRRETEIRMHLLIGKAQQAAIALLDVPSPADFDQEDLVYAAGITRDSERNRRALRRLLTATLASDRPDRATRARAYVIEHPVTQRWLRADPERRGAFVATWPREQLALPNGDLVELSAEDDPLEILRIGDYGASCLRRGGAFAYSAAALVLDAHRRVIYARRIGKDGVVERRPVARQIVALASGERTTAGTDDRIVRFPIYTGEGSIDESEEAGAHWVMTFRRYVDKRAAALGIPLFCEGDSDDEWSVQPLLSQDVYEDRWEVP